MSSQTISNTIEKSNSLRRAMRSNGGFSGLSGAVLLLDARPLAGFLGLKVPIVLALLGVVLLSYAITLFVAANQPVIPRRLAQTAIALDTGWVVGSLVILLTGRPALTVAGNWTVALLAEMVAVFAIWQAYALHRLSRSE